MVVQMQVSDQSVNLNHTRYRAGCVHVLPVVDINPGNLHQVSMVRDDLYRPQIDKFEFSGSSWNTSAIYYLSTKAVSISNVDRRWVSTVQGPPLGKWTSGCTSCFDDCGICCCVFCCLPCAHGTVVSKLKGGGCAGPCCLYFLGTMFFHLNCCICGPERRRGVREKYNLPAEPCGGAPALSIFLQKIPRK